MLNKIIQKEIEKGLPEPLYYIWSNETTFLEDSLSGFTETVLAAAPRDFNFDIFDSSSEPQKILDAAYTLPVMSSRRLVVIRDFQQLNKTALSVLMPYFERPSESTCMLALSQKPPKASIKAGWKVFSMELRERDIPAWLKNAAAGKGIKLTDDAVGHLIEFLGYETGLLMQEVEKLAAAGSKVIKGSDIMASTAMLRKYSPFDLIDSLIAGKKTRAFRILKTILSGSVMEAPSIVGTLNWHYGQFYSLWKSGGERPLKMREKTFRALSKYLPSYNEDRFASVFRSLHEADLGVKTSGRPEIVLEVLLIKLLQKEAWN